MIYLEAKVVFQGEEMAPNYLSQVEYVSRGSCEIFESEERDCQEKLKRIHSCHDELTGKDFEIIFCSTCNIAFTNPYPSEETLHYLYSDRSSENNFDSIKDTVVDQLKDIIGRQNIKSMVPGVDRVNVRRVLDFGTGNGRFAALSSQVFPSAVVDAVDYQEETPVYLASRFKDVNYYHIDKFLALDHKYDVILLRHVLEHNHRPKEFLSMLREKLTSTGMLYIEVPNLESWWSQKASRWVNSYSVPYHIYHYSSESLNKLITMCGLECKIGYNEMPLMGGIVASVAKQERSLYFQLIGILLNPFQLLLSALFGPPCINARCRRKSN